MLSFEKYQEIGKKIRESEERRQERLEYIRKDELRKRGIDPDVRQPSKTRYDHPCTPDDGFVTILYIVGMVGSLIFKDFWMLWIALTVGYVKFITRHDRD